MPANKWRTKTRIILICSTLAALIYASHLYVYHHLRGEATSWGSALAHGLCDWYSWALLSPAILWLASRYRFTKRNWKAGLLLHFLAGLFIAMLQVVLHAAADQLLIHQHYTLADVREQILILTARTYHFGVLVYWLIVIVSNAVEYYRQQELTASQLETQLAKAELQALRMQVNPHFLFNTLNTISSLMQEDVRAADRMIATLSDLLRSSLQHSEQEVSLKQELEFLQKYLEIEKVRFQDRLKIDVHVCRDLQHAAVPYLILQPIVENAIRHGIAGKRGDGILRVSAERSNGMLQMRVQDNGKGMSDQPAAKGNGIGLSNTRARLQQLYGDDHTLEITSLPAGGTEVRIAIPLREKNEETI